MVYLDHKEDIFNFIQTEKTIHQIKIEEVNYLILFSFITMK